MIEPKIDFDQLARVSRRSLRMYDLTPREKDICEIIIEFSFDCKREAVVIPSLDFFVEQTGIDKGDVSKAFKLLFARRVVQRRGPRDAWQYSFLPFASYWQETKPRFDPARAAARAVELDRINTQMKFGAPVEEPDLEDAMASVSRDQAVEPEIGETPTTYGVGKSPTGEIGDLPIGETPTTRDAGEHARDVTQNVSTKRYVTLPMSAKAERSKRFQDGERNHIFEQLSTIAAGPDFERYRGKWIQRVQDFPAIVQEAIGDVKMFRSNPRNKLRSAGAMIFRRCQQLNKSFHLL